jgi:hypothetical protein
MNAVKLAGRLTYAVAGQVDWRVRPRSMRLESLAAGRQRSKPLRSATMAVCLSWREDTAHERNSDCFDLQRLPAGAKPAWPKADALRM